MGACFPVIGKGVYRTKHNAFIESLLGVVRARAESQAVSTEIVNLYRIGSLPIKFPSSTSVATGRMSEMPRTSSKGNWDRLQATFVEDLRRSTTPSARSRPSIRSGHAAIATIGGSEI